MPLTQVTTIRRMTDNPKSPWVLETDGSGGAPAILKAGWDRPNIEPGWFEVTWEEKQGRAKRDGGHFTDYEITSLEPSAPGNGQQTIAAPAGGSSDDREYRIVWQACFKAVCQLPPDCIGDATAVDLDSYINAAHRAASLLLDSPSPEDAGPPDETHPVAAGDDIPF